MMKDRGGRNSVWLEIYLHNGGVTSAADAADVFLLQEVITSSML
jgi:hypothetical protein